MRIFLAMSLTHPKRDWMISTLRGAGHQVYDQRCPSPGTEPSTTILEPGEDYQAIVDCDAFVMVTQIDPIHPFFAGIAIGLRKTWVLWPMDGFSSDLEFRDQVDMEVETLEDLIENLAEMHAELTYAYTVPAGVQQCRVCGCWEGHACPGGCSWVEADLCSACKGQGYVISPTEQEAPKTSLLAYLLELPPHEVLTPEADGVEDARKVLYVHPEVLDELCYERDLSPEFLFFDGDPGDGLPCRFWLDVYSDGVLRICDRSEYGSTANDVGLPEGWVRKTARVVGEFGRELIRLDGSKWGKGVTS